MRYPLFFNTGGLIAGRGFIAHVRIEGRVVLDDADGEFWFYGVNPGGYAEGGSTIAEAQSAFLGGIRDIVAELADEAPDFDAFRSSVERFFWDENRTFARYWSEAVTAVRDGHVPRDEYRVVDASRKPTLHVALVSSSTDLEEPTEEPNPGQNTEEELLYACG